MASINELYSAASGLAFTSGVNSFAEVMPKTRFSSLYRGVLETKGFKWAELHFVKWIVAIVGRECRPPKCSAGCKYRMKYASDQRQVNALRVETIPFQDRCGWDIKPGRIGGRPDDYYPCSCA